jgi:hypothetical protein
MISHVHVHEHAKVHVEIKAAKDAKALPDHEDTKVHADHAAIAADEVHVEAQERLALPLQLGLLVTRDRQEPQVLQALQAMVVQLV